MYSMVARIHNTLLYIRKLLKLQFLKVLIMRKKTIFFLYGDKC